MYVKRIEMLGFKSFADRTTIELGRGITAIVGPNGCGKTNICDAIRWALGEDNVRLLRGSRIEDVIFGGTEKRKPTGMAEVSITLADVAGVLPVEYHEVTITRRAFRSGESEFFINKVPVRLKDIVDLFLGTGMGRRAYSVMEREMIDWILDDTGGQRRRIIEEAAGISKYKARRKETVNKLELTQRDLERVEDLIAEVDSRVRYLSRQAAKARRYERLTKRIREVETYASAREYSKLRDEIKKIDKRIEETGDHLTRILAEISSLEAEIEKKKIDALEREKQFTALGGKLSELRRSQVEIENQKLVISERKRALEDKLRELNEQHEAKIKARDANIGELDVTRRKIGDYEDKLKSLKSRVGDLEKAMEQTRGELKDIREKSAASARQELTKIKEQYSAASRLAELRSRKKYLGEAVGNLETRLQGIQNKLKSAESGLGKSRAILEKLTSKRDGMKEQARELAQTIRDLKAKVDEIRKEYLRLSQEAASVASRRELLDEMLERYEGFERGVAALLSNKKGDGVYGVIGDIVRCKQAELEPAVIAALANAIQYVVVDNREKALESVQLLKEKKEGSATLVCLDSLMVRQEDSFSCNEEGVIGRVSDFVDCEPRFRPLIDYLLKGIIVVRDIQKALELSEKSPSAEGYVTPQGDAIFRGSIIRAGCDGGSVDFLIGRRDKANQLAAEEESLRKLVREQELAFEELSKSLDELQRQYDIKSAEINDLQVKITETEKKLEQDTREHQVLVTSKRDAERELTRLKQELANLNEEIASVADYSQGEELQPLLFDVSQEEANLERKLKSLTEELKLTNQEILKVESEKKFLEARVENLTAEISTLEKDLVELEQTKQEISQKMEELECEEEGVTQSLKKLIEVIDEYESKSREAMEAKRSTEEEIESLRDQLKSVNSQRESLLIRREELKSQMGLLEMKAATLRKKIRDEYEVDIATVDLSSFESLESCDEELERLRKLLRNLGRVNLIALEEYETEKERLQFLRDQKEDLDKARQSLEEAIVQINRKARVEFLDTFDKVRNGFRRNFQYLFEGGDADLRLAEEADPLESPVEIFARPGGKRLENISLLSGGERALTAIAFLFAVYYTKPSPFCLLDEVDAPLDDANINRFKNLIKELAEETQFMIVTHNKRTMELADCLYGVTMEEPGVSKIVSVKFEKAVDLVGNSV